MANMVTIKYRKVEFCFAKWEPGTYYTYLGHKWHIKFWRIIVWNSPFLLTVHSNADNSHPFTLKKTGWVNDHFHLSIWWSAKTNWTIFMRSSLYWFTSVPHTIYCSFEKRHESWVYISSTDMSYSFFTLKAWFLYFYLINIVKP